MYRGGGRGGRGRGGRGRGGYHGRPDAHRSKIPRRKQYFETDATSTSAVLVKPIPEQLRWKFIQIRPSPGVEEYTRYELKLGEESSVERSVPRHRDNLQDIQAILVQKLGEGFEKTYSYKLDCQARLGKVVWLGDLIERGQKVIPGMRLCQFEKPPQYFDGKPYLKNEYFTRATVKDSIMAELERDHGAHDEAHFSLQIRIRDIRHAGEEFIAIVSKDLETRKFSLERLSNLKGILAEYASDMICFGRSHDVRIATKCFSLEEPPATHNITNIIDSIKLSEHGELKMILKSGPLQVQMIRRREKHVFHVRNERDWLIKHTKITEQPIPHDYVYSDRTVVKVDIAGHDNTELDVTLERNIERGVYIREVVDEIMRLIEFSLEIVELSERHIDF